MSEQLSSVAFVGGTGPEGLGLAIRFAAAGRAIFIGSRTQERAEEAKAKVLAAVPEAAVEAHTNEAAVTAASVVVLTVPFDAQADTLTSLRSHIGGKIVISAVVPLRFEKSFVSVVQVPEGSAAQQAAALLPEARLAAAFHHLSAPRLMALEEEIEADVLICGDDAAAKTEAMALASCIKGCRGVDGGMLDNARYVEALTAVLLSVNRTYKTRAAIRLTGL